jgi:transposase
MVTSYIGADVDCKMTELAVERRGKVEQRDRVPTDIRSLRSFLGSISGTKVMVIEEGPMSGWLYRNLRSYVETFVVCDPRRNKAVYADGDKTDPIDAAALAALYRGGYIREVYHTDDEGRLALKGIVSLYHDRVREAVRQINKLRGCARGCGVRIPVRTLRDRDYRKDWLTKLKDQALAERLAILWVGLDAVRQQVKRSRGALTRGAKKYPIIKYWLAVSGIGLIRAVTLFAYLDTPWRFKTPKKLWKYCGLGLRRTSSGTGKDGRPQKGYVRLHRAVNRRLKAAVQGAALSAIMQGFNPFAAYYHRAVRDGMTPSNARHAVARKLLTVMWGMWKTNSRYEACLV